MALASGVTGSEASFLDTVLTVLGATVDAVLALVEEPGEMRRLDERAGHLRHDPLAQLSKEDRRYGVGGFGEDRRRGDVDPPVRPAFVNSFSRLTKGVSTCAP